MNHSSLSNIPVAWNVCEMKYMSGMIYIYSNYQKFSKLNLICFLRTLEEKFEKLRKNLWIKLERLELAVSIQKPVPREIMYL